ncbi:MAG: sulfite exporter TauE/SafE family protein [Saprospiraceae bacterium]|nr:sulfite exporter TauE/SafE family protein [Saprospiraceae bacterium]
MSFELIVLTGLATGLFGSLHCVGMCGPIALSLSNTGQNIATSLLYNFGRAISYSFMGLFFGFIGNHFALAGLQQLLSILAGSLILIIFLFHYFIDGKPWWISRWYKTVQNALSELISKPKTSWFPFELGILNAWLPCGLVYLALMTAMASGSPWSGAGLMFFFGLGTIPLMFVLMLFGQKLHLKYRMHIQKMIPVFIIAVALLLILRGLNLGIPYLSPKAGFGESCH